MSDKPKTTDYCARCGESPESGTHLFNHDYVDPRTAVPVELRDLVGLRNVIWKVLADADGGSICRAPPERLEGLDAILKAIKVRLPPKESVDNDDWLDGRLGEGR